MTLFVIIFALLSCVHGLQQASNVAQDRNPGDTTQTEKANVTPQGPRNFGKVPGVQKTLKRGQSVGVPKTSILGGFHWDDTDLITQGLHGGEMRHLKSVECAHLGSANFFIGLVQMYESPSGSQKVSTYRGWLPVIKWRVSHNTHVLTDGESWTSVDYKFCNDIRVGKLVGVCFNTNKKSCAVACGNYSPQEKDPPYVGIIDICHVGTLRPERGRKIIGLYGEAEKAWQYDHQGIRGLGLITVEE